MISKKYKEVKKFVEFNWKTEFDMYYCDNCGKMTSHKVTFVSGHMYDKRCTDCHTYICYEADLKRVGIL